MKGAAPGEPVRVVDGLMDLLSARGVVHVYGVPGAAITPIHHGMHASGRFRHVLAKHEEGAALMAYGHARVSRQLGVCVVTGGPGGTNALTGVATAQADATPLLLITGQVPRSALGRGALQESSYLGLDLVEMYRSVTKLSAMPITPQQVLPLVCQGIALAESGCPGAVHLNLPSDLLWEKVAPVSPPFSVSSAVLDPAAVRHAAELVFSTPRTVLLAGSGVDVADGSRALLRLAEHWRLPVATTPKAKGTFPEDHPLSLGVFGFGGHSRATKALLEEPPDLLLVVGSGLGELATDHWDERLSRIPRLIQVDIQASQIGLSYPVELGVLGDAKAVLEALHGELQAIAAGSGERPIAGDSRGLGSPLSFPCPPSVEVALSERRLQPSDVMAVLRQALPDNAIVFIDNGNCILWAGHDFQVRAPHTYFATLGLASMGTAVAAIVGAQIAAPEQRAVAIVGDAAFAMNGIEVHTAVEHEVPAIWLVLNNGGHGMVHQGESLIFGNDLGACSFSRPIDAAAMAEALGAKGYRIQTLGELREALQAALRCAAPAVLDVQIDTEAVPPQLKTRAQAVRKAFSAK